MLAMLIYHQLLIRLCCCADWCASLLLLLVNYWSCISFIKLNLQSASDYVLHCIYDEGLL